MSRHFLQSFFPSVTHIAIEITPRTVAFLFPVTCPALFFGSIRNPCLGLWALWGILIGTQGAFVRKSSRGMLWRLAFGFFGAMNAVAIPLHCCLIELESSSSQITTSILLWALDCLLTGTSSSAIILASIVELKGAESQLYITTKMVLIGAGVASLISYYSLGTLGLELWYLHPTVLAGIAVCWLTGGTNTMMKLGGALFIFGALVDAPACRHLQGGTADLFMLSSLTFLGCNISFIGLDQWLLRRHDSSKHKNR